MSSKLAAFKNSKKLLHKWISSPSAPSDKKIQSYAKRLIKAGYVGIDNLMEAFSEEIDYKKLDATRRKAATDAKPAIVDAIWDLEGMIKELESQSESDSFNFIDKEFKIGYPERFAKGEFYPIENYFKNWKNKKEDAVNICPFSSKGEIITIHGLNIQLPKTPTEKSKILFSKLPKKDQYWRRSPPPNITKENVDSYTKFILEEYRRRREGVFFKNNGKTVYLTGNHYFALQWCKIYDIKNANGENYMDFREAQLNMFYHMEACIVDKKCLGQLFVKSRRTGFTYCSLALMLNNGTSSMNSMFGMTSKTEEDVKKAFMKLTYMFQNLPFYFRPVVRGSEDSRKSLEFGKPTDKSKEAKKLNLISTEDYLNTLLDYRATTEGAYDSVQLKMYIGDEFGKWNKDYIKHLGQIAPTMMPAGRVVGKAFLGSTIGPLEEGGQNAKDLYYSSNVLEKEKKSQQTPTALYSYFLPAQDNMPEFTDIYGKCWKTAPPKKTLNVYGDEITMGSNEYLDALEDKANKQSDKLFSAQKRAYPRNVEDAFRNTEDSSVFNRNKIYEQLSYNDRQDRNLLYATGNFEWKDGVEDSDVVFRHNPYGRFKVSWMPSAADDTLHLQNRVRESEGKFYPMNKELGCGGCDPFSLGGKHSKGSRGAIHALTHKITPDGVPRDKFLFEYDTHEEDTVFFEDVIKVLRFYGIPILVEQNRIDLLRHMYNRGYRGFSMNRLDKTKLNEIDRKYGGQPMSGESIISSHMNMLGSWIEDNVGCSTKGEIRPLGEMGDFPFNNTLNDWLGFNPEKRGKSDATISSGMTVMAINKNKFKKEGGFPKVKVLNFIKQYDYKDAVIHW
jgi:hypothetical protein